MKRTIAALGLLLSACSGSLSISSQPTDAGPTEMEFHQIHTVHDGKRMVTCWYMSSGAGVALACLPDKEICAGCAP